MEQELDITEPLKSALSAVVEKWKAAGWKIRVARPTYSNYPNPRISIEVTSKDETAHALTRFDEDDSLPAKLDSLIRGLSN